MFLSIYIYIHLILQYPLHIRIPSSNAGLSIQNMDHLPHRSGWKVIFSLKKSKPPPRCEKLFGLWMFFLFKTFQSEGNILLAKSRFIFLVRAVFTSLSTGSGTFEERRWSEVWRSKEKTLNIEKISIRNYQPHGTLSSLEVTRRNPTSKLVSITVRPLSFKTKSKHSAEARGTVVGKTFGGETGWQMGHFGWMIRRLKKPPCSWWRWQLRKVSVYPDRKEKPNMYHKVKGNLYLKNSEPVASKVSKINWNSQDEKKKIPHQNQRTKNIW